MALETLEKMHSDHCADEEENVDRSRLAETVRHIPDLLPQNTGEILYVHFLGQFSMHLSREESMGIVSGKDSSSWRLLAFLQYLCMFHDRAITQDEIFDVLWSDIDSASPANTMKTLLHRSRAMLEKLGIKDGKQALQYRRGVYSWNTELTVLTDVDVFDQLMTRFQDEPSSPQGQECARQALALYQGDFLPSAAGSPWALSPRTYYHTRFLQLSFEMANVLWEQDQLAEAIDICRTANSVDPYDETCQLLMMKLLYASGARQAAIQHYNNVADLLMAQLGITPSEELTAFYRELNQTNQSDEPEMDMQAIRSRLEEDDDAHGALFCEYKVFREIYAFITRSELRTGRVAQLAVITLLDRDGSFLNTQRAAAAMEALKNAIAQSLRSGDVVTKLTSAQFLIMLPTASFENGKIAVERALNIYGQTLFGKSTLSKFSLLSAHPSKVRSLAQEQGGSRAESTWKRSPRDANLGG